MKNILKKAAFTLTELLIALAVIGVLVAILLPMIFNIMPDQNALMAKRAYYVLQTVTSNLINDAGCYPDLTQSLDPRDGFDDGYGYANCQKWGGEDDGTCFTLGSEGDMSCIENEDANLKFVTLFTDQLDIKGDVTTNTSTQKSTFKTKDGMEWTISDWHLESTNADKYIKITIDVNGDDKPNCSETAATTSSHEDYASCAGREEGFDRFEVTINADGGLAITDSWAQDAVDGTKDVTGDDDE